MSAARVTLVTGFPNYRATHLARHLLDHRPDDVWSVVTAGQLAHAEGYRAQLPPAARERLRFFTGDPSAIDMGLSGAEYRELVDAVGCVQHLAPTTGQADGRDPFEALNVGGTREVLELARAARRMESIVFHSSVDVSGDREGLILESDLSAGQRFPGPGSATLARAELMARRRMQHLPIVILRTGQVVGPSTGGPVAALEGVYLLILLILNSPQDVSALLPRCGDAPLHVVPIDCLVRAAEAASLSRDVIGQTLHLTDPNPMTVRLAFNRCVQIRARLSEAGLVIPPVSTALRRQGLLRDGLQSILWRPRTFINTTFRSVHYATEGVERWLGRVGLSCPPLESYFEHLVRHVAQTVAHQPSASKAS